MTVQQLYFSFVIGLLLPLLTSPTISAAPTSSFPILTLEPGRHTATIRDMAVDRHEHYAVTASHDKTLRVWDIRNQGKLLRIIRPPIGEGNEGRLDAVAISPDGELIAAGGWTNKKGLSKNVYLFKRSTGQLVRRISGLPNVISGLAFSHNGRRLAVALGNANGIRVFDPHNGKMLSKDTQYGGKSYSVDFDVQGHLVSTSNDGYVRLYDASHRLLKRYRTQGGNRPFRAHFSPDGRHIALGFADSTQVEILTAQNLSLLRTLNTSGINKGNLSTVAWLPNGRWIYAGGRYDNGRGNPVLALSLQGGQRRVLNASGTTIMAIHLLRDGGLLYASGDPTLGRLNAAGKTLWRRTSGKLDFRGKQARRNFKLSADGSRVWFHHEHERESGGQRIKGKIGWDMNTQALLKSAATDLQNPRLQAGGLIINNWEYETNPSLNGKALPLEQYETSRSLAIAPSNRGFTLGTSWYVRYFNSSGQQRWQMPVSRAWAVNISKDSRWVVAALGDGTIRWYETNTGKERLAFYLHPDQKRWIAWTPQGFYSASSEQAERLMGYHLNHGADKAAQFVRVDQLKQVYARRDLVARALEPDYPQLAQQALQRAGDVRRLLRADRLPPEIQIVGNKTTYQVQQRHFRLPLKIINRGGGVSRIEYRLNGKLLPPSEVRSGGLAGFNPRGEMSVSPVVTLTNGSHELKITAFGRDGKVPSESVKVAVNMQNPAQQHKPVLHVLSVGVSDYRRAGLNLPYAANDAEAIHQLLKTTENKGLYQRINARKLINEQATAANIQRELSLMASQVKDSDVFILFMSGHGKSVDAEYHFLPQELQFTNMTELKQRSVSARKLVQWLQPIKAQKKLLLLDTCNTGPGVIRVASAWQNDGFSSIRNVLDDEVAIEQLRNSAGISVIGASTKNEVAIEGIVDQRTKQGHGLFTYVVLEALRGSADTDRNAYVSVSELDAYIKRRVPVLSRQKWRYEQSPISVTSGNYLLFRH